MQKAVNFIAGLLKILPIEFQNRLFEIVLKHIPFRVLRQIPCSYSTYLKCNWPEEGDVILDCGAHVGNCSIIFSRLVGKTGLVIALEPFKEAYALLEDRLQRMNLGNVIALNKGLWNLSDRLPVTVLSDTLYSRIDPEKISDGSAGDAVIDVTTIDRIVEDLKLARLNMIKMDIEGAEIEALQGAAKTLQTLKPCLAIASYHHRNGQQTFRMVESTLDQEGYSVHTFFPPHLTTCARYNDNR